MKVFAALFLFVSAASWAAEPSRFPADTCSNGSLITKEMVELELSGFRWAGGISPCLKQSRFQSIVASKEKVGDKKLLKPEYILPKGREIKIISQTELRTEEVIVKFAYIGRAPGSTKAVDVPVTDELSYRRNYGDKRDVEGCASILEEPEHLVLREQCY